MFKTRLIKFSLFRFYLHFGKGHGPFLKKLETPSPKNDLCQVWLKSVHRVLEKNLY